MADVSTLADLFKIVERTQTTIMHHSQEDVHHYYVPSGNLVYHYAVQTPMIIEETAETPEHLEIETTEKPGFFKRLFSRSQKQNGKDTITEEDIISLDDAMRRSFDAEETKE